MSTGKFDAVCAAIKPIVFDNVPVACSVGCATQIVEDIAYMITHGYTNEIIIDKDSRRNKREFPPEKLNLPEELEKSIRERGFIDISTAWGIARFYPEGSHHPECSFRQSNGGVLCDCDVLKRHIPKELTPKQKEFREYAKDKVIPIIHKRKINGVQP
jgi:hypothetical protein